MGKIKNGIVEIGMPWGYNKYTELSNNYYSRKMYENINTVDFIPIIPRLNEKNTKLDKNTAISVVRNLYKPDVEKGIKYYNSILRKLGLSKSCSDVKVLRLYMTDDTQLAETITNEYTDNALGSMIGGISDSSVVQTIKKFKSSAYLTPTEISDFTSSKVNTGGFVKKTMGFLEAISSGLRFDFPVVWDKTSYSRRTSINVVLSTPYGDPESVYIWIIKPLLYLIALGTPVNINGAIGWPLYCRIKSHGLFDITMGAIESITIDRGGQNTTYNIYKQPLKVILSISVRDLYSSLSVDYSVSMTESQLKNKITNVSDPYNQNYVSEINKVKSPMPTVDKLVDSFMPMKPKIKHTESQMTYIKNTDTIEEKYTIIETPSSSTTDIAEAKNDIRNTLENTKPT